MRLLLSRGTLVGAIVLITVGVAVASAPQRHLVAQTALAAQVPISAPRSAPTPRWLNRPVFPTPTPPSRSQVATRVVKPAPVAAPVPAPPTAAAIMGTGQFALINQDRQAAGLPPLQWNDCLANIANGQAARMAAQGYISHAGGRILDLGCHLGPRTGENIGVQDGIKDVAMNAWFMGDAPHRANILGPYHYVAAAWVWGANHRSAYLAVEFG